MAQVTTAHVKCGKCSHEFLIDTAHELTEIRCPYCQTKMADDMVEKVLHAWGYVSDLNADFVKYHIDREEPLFSVQIESDEVPMPSDETE